MRLSDIHSAPRVTIAFIGPQRDPARTIWIIQWGMICGVAVIPLALIAGSVRGIPVRWMLIDVSFGILGIIPFISGQSSSRDLGTFGTSRGRRP